MKLGELVAAETGIPVQSLMLLRHSNESIRALRTYGASVEEYTAIQPPGAIYDYLRDPDAPISAVVVIVDDRVYGVYRIAGILRTGLSPNIASPAYAAFEQRNQQPPTRRHYFDLRALPSSTNGQVISGWRGREIVRVLRGHGRVLGPGEGTFFDEIDVDGPVRLLDSESLRSQLCSQIDESLRLSDQQRQQLLQEAPVQAERVAVISYEFRRNAHVVTEVLKRANGICEACKQPAPFLRQTDRSPYLEVHHRTPLAEGGHDTVANAQVLCPNCHRKAHHG